MVTPKRYFPKGESPTNVSVVTLPVFRVEPHAANQEGT